MPQVDYSATIEVGREAVWQFVKNLDNWAPFAKGYQSHEVVNDDESVWTVKGDVGPISRVTKFHVHVTEWMEGEGVTFVLKGLNEPISGQGAIRLKDTNAGQGTEIRADASLEVGGTLGPVVNHLLLPWIRGGADDLVTKIAVALQPDYVRPSRPPFFIRWLESLRRLLQRVLRRGAST